MGLLNWYRNNRDLIIKNISKRQNNLSSEWNNFLKRETYLTGDIRKNLDFSLLPHFHWFFLVSGKVRRSFSEYKGFRDQIKVDVDEYNPLFLKERLKKYKKIFDGEGLDDLQRKAIVVDEKNNLVIAGAGAGKTKVLTSKINYLLKRQDKPIIRPERILVLTFNRDARDEINKRLKEDFGIENVNIKTYHKLGYDILGRSPLFEGSKYKTELKRIFDILLENVNYQEMVLEYLSDHIDEDATFEDKEEYYNYMREKKYTTLKNEKVKSLAEREIANFLFTHNIDYEYEKEIDWIRNNKKEYRPDFYLPKYDIYIEHWGLDEDNKVPEWFEGENPTEKYLKDKEWKINQFEKHSKKLIQSWNYDRRRGLLIDNLIKNLKETLDEINFKRLSYKEIVEKTHFFKEGPKELIEMISSFINIAKSNGLLHSEIKKRTSLKEYSERQRLFGKIALEVFINYEKFLKEEGKIDFNDMMIKSKNKILENSQDYTSKYDYILIDEFQDISKPRLDMIKALLCFNRNTKLFCVGDDWQSINGFAGSEVDYFINFKNHFDFCEEIHLKTNYRSSKIVVDMSNKLISMNKKRIKKDVVHFEKNGLVHKAKLYVLPEMAIDDEKHRIDEAIKLILRLKRQGIDEKDILVLSRFNRILNRLQINCCNCNPLISIEEKNENDRIVNEGLRVCSVHKSKGLQSKHVILLDVVSGTYGFPSEIKDSSVLEIARKDKNRNAFEEERRLFYVALTRSKEFLYIFTIKDNQSIFLDEIKKYMEKKYL